MNDSSPAATSTGASSDSPDISQSAPAAPEAQALRYVPFEALDLEYKFWANPRTHTGMGDTEIQDLATSILAGTQSGSEGGEEVKTYAGVRVPLEVVMIRSNGSFLNLVIDGQRRHKAIEVAHLPPDTLVPVLDLEPEPIEWTREIADYYLLRALSAVGTRAGLSSFELSESAVRLRDSKDKETGKPLTLAKIAAAIGRSESWCSRFLSARERASPKLIHQWKMGELTDEQFKDLAAERNPERQAENAKDVVEARTSGDRATARTIAKERKIVARSAAPAEPKGGKATGPTVSLGSSSAKAAPAAEPKPEPRKPPSFAIVEDLLDMGKRKPPTHDYVKGLMDGVRWASGLMDAAKFGKAWVAYMQHVAGARAAKPEPAKAKAKPTGKKSSKKRR